MRAATQNGPSTRPAKRFKGLWRCFDVRQWLLCLGGEAHDSGVNLDLGTLEQLLTFAALIAATEFYALVIHRRAARRRAEAQTDGDQETDFSGEAQASSAPRGPGDEGRPSSRWVRRWRAMSSSTSDDSDESGPG